MKYRNVILINPYNSRARGVNEATVYPPLGLASMAAVLRSNDINVKIIDASGLRLKNFRVLNIIKKIKPDLVGVSLNIVNAAAGAELISLIKNNMNTDVCIGGPYVSSTIEEALKRSGADFAVKGEGETALLEICKGTPAADIKGTACKGQSDITIEPAEITENLDELPFPAYDLLPRLTIYRSRTRRTPMASIITSRGCPYGCTFCNHSIFGKKFRAFSPQKTVALIETLINEYEVKQIDIQDDNFTFDMKRAERIFDLIIERRLKIALNLQNGIRADRLSYPLVKKMKKAGVFKAGIGCESGSPLILKKINKNLELSRVEKAVRWFRKENILTYCFFIIGFPEETEETVRSTVDLALKYNPSIATFARLTPFPGTEIFREMERNSLLKENIREGINDGFWGGRMYHRCRSLSEPELMKIQSRAYRKFYLRPLKLLETAASIRSINELFWLFNLIKSSLTVLSRLK